jgi:hypothetical protein
MRYLSVKDSSKNKSPSGTISVHSPGKKELVEAILSNLGGIVNEEPASGTPLLVIEAAVCSITMMG